MRKQMRRIHFKLMGTPEKNPGFMRAVGLRLKAARLALEKNQGAMADAIGVAPNTYNQWEKGKRKTQLEAMIRLCNKYPISLDWLYRGQASSLPQSIHDSVLKHHQELTKPRAVSQKKLTKAANG